MAHSGKYIQRLVIKNHFLLCMEQYYLQQQKEEASLHQEQHHSLHTLDSKMTFPLI